MLKFWWGCMFKNEWHAWKKENAGSLKWLLGGWEGGGGCCDCGGWCRHCARWMPWSWWWMPWSWWSMSTLMCRFSSTKNSAWTIYHSRWPRLRTSLGNSEVPLGEDDADEQQGVLMSLRNSEAPAWEIWKLEREMQKTAHLVRRWRKIHGEGWSLYTTAVLLSHGTYHRSQEIHLIQSQTRISLHKHVPIAGIRSLYIQSDSAIGL